MPPKRVTLKYYATLPIAEEPEYKDGYHCDYCNTYFDKGPLYHCPATGTDGCIQCVESRGNKPGSSSKAAVHSNTKGEAAAAPSYAPSLPCGVGLLAFPSRDLFNEANASLRRIADNFRASSNSMTNSLFLAATEGSSLVMGYMLQTNVMGALLSTGASIMVILDGGGQQGGMGAACLAVPGNDAILSCARSFEATFGRLSSTSTGIAVEASPAYNTIVPVLADQLQALFPWIGRLRTMLATSTARPWSSFHRPMPQFVPTPGTWPPFLQLCSATSPNPSPTPSSNGSEGSYFACVTSEGLLQVSSFIALHEIQWSATMGIVKAWDFEGERRWDDAVTASTRHWVGEFLRIAVA